MDRKIEEGFKAHFPHLKDLVELSFVDPRNDEEKTICFERYGRYYNLGKIYNGSYIVYNDHKIPKKFIGVFVAERLDEDQTGENPVKVVSLDGSKVKTTNRLLYRMRISEKKISEMEE